MALRKSIDVGAGVIDADYWGPVGVLLFNHYNADFEVKRGDRIAHLILQKIVMPEVLEVEDLDSTERETGGFDSTGVRLSRLFSGLKRNLSNMDCANKNVKSFLK